MPANPTSSPSTRCSENVSVRKISTAIGSTTSGVMPFQIPARRDGIRCSPYPNSVHGIAEPIAPSTNECSPEPRVAGAATRA